MKPLIKYNAVLPGALGKLIGENWSGVCLPPIGIFFKDAKVTDKLFKHECCHWYQAARLGILYYPVMFLDYKTAGYDNSVLEKEAKEYSKQPLTAIERAWKDGSK